MLAFGMLVYQSNEQSKVQLYYFISKMLTTFKVFTWIFTKTSMMI